MGLKSKSIFQELNVLKGQMKENNITYEEMAKILGKSTSGCCKIFNGDVDIKRTTMKKIITYMNKKTNKAYKLDDLFG